MSNLNQFTNGILKYNTQQSFSLGGSSVQSSAFQSDTVAIMIASVADDTMGAGAYFDIGTNPTATTSNVMMPRVGAVTGAQQNSGSGHMTIGVNGGEKLAALRSSGYNVDVNIIELKY